MIDTSTDTDSRTTSTEVLEKCRLFLSWIKAVLGATRRSAQKTEAAHASRCIRASFTAEAFQDTGIDPSDATGIPSWQPDLPFFMQRGFGRK